MRIQTLQLKNFKRFTDVTLQGIPANAKLVLLIGSNGSGKSSVFDAFGFLSNNLRGSSSRLFEHVNYGSYYNKKNSEDFYINVNTYEYGAISFAQNGYSDIRARYNLFYGRTSFRQIPSLTRTSLGQERFNIEMDNDKPAAFIDRDARFENDLEHVFGKLLKDFFRTDNDKSVIKNEIVIPINNALERIFGGRNGTKLSLIELIPPIEGKVAQINFIKGKSEFHYHQLSAGEKEVFNILLNLIARKEYYQDTVYFFDEIDLHLNTKLQYNFLKEITENWIPENCQLWTASHSIGFIQYSKDSEDAVIFDFDDYDFDYPRILSPEPKDNPNLYNIAIDKDILPSLFKNFKIVFVENTDTQFYAALNIENTIFIPENGRNGVYHKVKQSQYHGIVDRDFLSDDDILQIQNTYQNLSILKYYSVENYLYHPDNLGEYYSSINKAFDKDSFIVGLIAAKNAVKDQIILTLGLKRTEYPYFGEPFFNGKPEQNRFKNKEENFQQAAIVAKYLQSDELEKFYKALPMKSYATHLPERQNIPKTELSKTDWFKTQIENIIK